MPSKLIGLRTVAGRVRGLAALALVALAVLSTATGVAVGHARDGLRTLGDREGPMVLATGDMYLALGDMDAQVTNVLLTGDEEGWLCDPEASDCERGTQRYVYDIRREDAQRAGLQAARLAKDDPVRLRTVQAVLDGLHAYDQNVQAAMQAARSPKAMAEPPPEAVRRYRAATALMTEDLLPKARNLTLDGAADVDAAYEDEHSAVLAGRFRVIGAGLALLAALAGLQVYLARRFRRLVSLPLAAALAGALALTVAGASLLATEADRLRAAKSAGFDPVLDLTRLRAIGQGMDTDRSRRLIDPAGAVRYDQMYLEKAQTIRYVKGAAGMDAYNRALDRAAARNGAAAAYRVYQDHDRAVRDLAERGDRVAAARAHLDPRWTALPHPAFRTYHQRLDALISRHEFLRIRAVARGDRAAEPWTWLPAAGALAIAALIAAGVWPRLSEYR
ncbi:hypothetical protein [Actinomadura madurae]|uniref:hypothetical protein n=1 Tax=Actinomadura madurae TaxID=1993 RepID=UPI002025BB40|nr:hypothetical protein [Actinomadura madurae]MCP9953291.1 hypothetical protein [Actinomadura madurae]MCP9982507.1 hypothetical protein [Actinomadura madurae]MCQ0018755.1 hypothetical protein [Actinomadura madurae]URM98757.1 hypothetical protein LUW76_32935 [Actinomadura madurae]